MSVRPSPAMKLDIDLPGFKKDEINSTAWITVTFDDTVPPRAWTRSEQDKEGKYIRKGTLCRLYEPQLSTLVMQLLRTT